MKYFFLFTCLILTVLTKAQVKPIMPVPSPRQQQWQNMEFYLFVHFGPNTFTDLEWGKGTEKEEVFNPSKLDCSQWCRIAKAAGAKGIIITAKHHDGFCLWPSKYSTHTVAQSTWKNGKGDVLKELSDACKRNNLKFGVYLSPWDRNHPAYGTDAYNDIYINMMKEVVKNYGPFFEFWWDGANGEGPNGKKQVYDWHSFESTLRTIAPNTCVFSDIGPDIRWMGTERGFAGKTNWDLLDTAGFSRGAGAPSEDTLNAGNKFGKTWLEGECDVSIRPGWFYHDSENEKVKTPEELFTIYLKSVGRGASLLLNVPPDRDGLISKYDSASLVNFKRLRDESFQTNLSNSATIYYLNKNAQQTTKLLNDNNSATFIQTSLNNPDDIKINLLKPSTINCIVLSEPVQMGQRVSSFTVSILKNNEVVKEIDATTIGRKRILTFQETEADAIKIQIKEAKAVPLISEIGVYKIDDNLIEKE